MSLATTTLSTPLGPLRLHCTPLGLCRLEFCREHAPDSAGQRGPGPGGQRDPETAGSLSPSIGRAVAAQLAEYFRGERRRFDCPLDLRGTPFQLLVWNALRSIPYGTTISYGDLARRLGLPGAARAVGAALRANPVPIIIPCHRVVAADGTLGGYSAGRETKTRLLLLEADVS